MTPQEFAELRDFFAQAELPQKLRYNAATFFTDLPKAVYADLYILQQYGYTHTFAASFERLKTIKKMLEEGNYTEE